MINNIAALLSAPWGAEQWINEGWNTLTYDEKQAVQDRMTILFSDGLPFDIQHDKQLYVYVFSFLAQLEVLAIQVPLKFESQLSKPELQQRMRQQLLDEIFHGMVFTKIAYMLSEPFAYPLPYNTKIEALCDFIRQETCPKTAVRLLNLVAEGWIEEIFSIFAKHCIAPKVFNIILQDETRHVSEADLYHDIGLPELASIKLKIAQLEKLLIESVFLQDDYIISISSLLGFQGSIDFLNNLHQKHGQQLQKIGVAPSEYWQFYMSVAKALIPQIESYGHYNSLITMSPMRQIFMEQWGNPTDPTMVGEFDIDITALDFFQKKCSREMITLIMLKSLSQMAVTGSVFRQFLRNHQLFRSEQAYIGLIVKLPGCYDHIGTIVFENPHLYAISTLKERIEKIIECMVFCYKKRAVLEETHPVLLEEAQKRLLNKLNAIHPAPVVGNAVISLSNIGPFGYQRCKSPLRQNEAMKFTLMDIQRRPQWNHDTQQFEPKDFLPVSCSADHRIFDGNISLPKILRQHAEEVMLKLHEKPTVKQFSAMPDINELNKLFNTLEADSQSVLHTLLHILSTYWPDFIDLNVLVEHANATVCSHYMKAL